MNARRFLVAACLPLFLGGGLRAQSYTWVSSTANEVWKQSTVKLQARQETTPQLEVKDTGSGVVFRNWGTCFNELGWDALNVLTRQEQDEILGKLFAPDGDLRFTMGRFSMNANDYARDWYSCDEVAGDFSLKFFTIERDKQALIPYIRAAQKFNPDLTFWISPWSPPSWMKVNGDYPVRSDKQYNRMCPLSDVLLFGEGSAKQEGVFPERLAVNDYMIQDPRFLQAYADYFCRFISAYKEQGIPVKMVMYQNEAYSYTPYPGCAWTAEGTIRFNADYLAPALQKNHPDVELYLGTINTNRYDYIDKILSDPALRRSIKGVGFQWEGGQILPAIRAKYPELKYVQTESECGWGSFDWKSGEHTFKLLNHYIGNGCEEYTFWNAILCDDGMSTWGWKQNALIRVDSQKRIATFTPEYYAVKHYTHYLQPGSRVLSCHFAGEDKMPVLVALTPQKKYVVMAGNFNEEARQLTLKLGNRYLNAELPPHSYNTFVAE